jgi:aspartokinase/homoserine dehydrogenase 1
MWLDCDDPDFDQAFQDSGGKRTQVWRPNDLDQFTTHVRRHHRHAILIDCTASDAVADCYVNWLNEGIHVVTSNKMAVSGRLDRWQAIRAAGRGETNFRYEATVCAGLSVVQTLRDMIKTGDRLTSIEGMLSSTLTWIFNQYDGSIPFSSLVRSARALGYTEPDPRSDLSSIDVARKLVILARDAGWPLSLHDVVVESLVPPELESVQLDQFMMRLEELDAPMMVRLNNARATGGVLRHVAQLDNYGRAHVHLKVIDAKRPFAHTRMTDNVVQFSSGRYCENPLLVQGPGAGPAVTAAAVFADVLRIAESLSREHAS